MIQATNLYPASNDTDPYLNLLTAMMSTYKPDLLGAKTDIDMSVRARMQAALDALDSPWFDWYCSLIGQDTETVYRAQVAGTRFAERPRGDKERVHIQRPQNPLKANEGDTVTVCSPRHQNHAGHQAKVYSVGKMRGTRRYFVDCECHAALILRSGHFEVA